jgi:hypothetical protein
MRDAISRRSILSDDYRLFIVTGKPFLPSCHGSRARASQPSRELAYQGRKRMHNADEIMAEIVAKRLVEHLERTGFVVMKRPPEIGGQRQ